MKWTDIDLKNKTAGTHKFVCPECSPTRKNKRDLCLSVDIDRGVYNCHHCGAKGSRNEFKAKPKELPVMPKLNTTDLSEKMFSYFQSRHISSVTIKRNKITEGARYIPQDNSEVNCIWFNYFKNSEHVNTKFRSAKKQFTQVKNAPKHFYKIDDVTDEAIITEGEFDALSYEEAGFNFAISVPDGALPPNANYSETKFEYIDNDIDVLLGVKTIYLSIDSDPAGQHLQKELSRRVGREKCRIIDLSPYKDANEVLCALGRVDGISFLIEAKNNAREYPIEGMQSVSSYQEEIMNIYEHGYDTGVGVGFAELDTKIRWKAKYLYLITGIPSHGKSTWFDQVMIKLMERSDWKFAVYSPEHEPEMHIPRLLRQLLKKSFFGSMKMSKDEIQQAVEWLNERLFFIMPNDANFGLDNILGIAKQMVAQKGINGLVIDPWNTLDHQTPKGTDKGDYISQCLTKMKLFAKNSDVAVVLVAHPTKMPKNEDGTYKVPTGYNISDSAHFYNKADFGVTVFRNFETGIVDIIIWKVKFEGILGEQATVQFAHDKVTATYYGLNETAPHIEHENNLPVHKISRPNESDYEEGFNQDVPF